MIHCKIPKTENEIEALLGLEKECFPEEPWGQKQWKIFAQNQRAYVLLCFLDEKPVGYLIANRVLDETEVLRIGVASAARGQGIGSALFKRLEQEVFESSSSQLFLEVREDNQQALRLYRKVGFDLIGKRKDYYSSPRCDALVLSKRPENPFNTSENQ